MSNELKYKTDKLPLIWDDELITEFFHFARSWSANRSGDNPIRDFQNKKRNEVWDGISKQIIEQVKGGMDYETLSNYLQRQVEILGLQYSH